MTKDEIKKALEFCAKDHYYFCGGCPYDDVRNCNDKLKTDALNVITEQERKIEQLKDGYARVQEQLRAQERFAKYQIVSDKEIKAQVKQAQIDVLKELKTRHDYAIKNMGYPWDISQQIDELIKEIENEN